MDLDALRLSRRQFAYTIAFHIIFPSFTIGGRVRLQTDVRVSYELISDFMLTATLFDTFDSKPPSAVASKHDYGTTFAITWTF